MVVQISNQLECEWIDGRRAVGGRFKERRGEGDGARERVRAGWEWSGKGWLSGKQGQGSGYMRKGRLWRELKRGISKRVRLREG